MLLNCGEIIVRDFERKDADGNTQRNMESDSYYYYRLYRKNIERSIE